mmetsp:Transcript_40841/g.41461  ORF Transcript_40841/g.41461 Transcript_40841/m.41461 type:complete len:361 (+) Transcript_40841:50-1132(+)
MGCRDFSAALLCAWMLAVILPTSSFIIIVDGFSYSRWSPPPKSISSVAAPTSIVPTRVPTKNHNQRYPTLPLDNYLANPFFHKINTHYPGLQLIHEDPFIFLVNQFLTEDECTRLMQKAMTDTHLIRPQIGGGAVVRTSNGVVCENEEVPTIRQKMSELTQVSNERQLQPLKISRYNEGEEFSKHTDAWPTEGAPVNRGWVHEEDFFGDLKRPIQGCLSSRNQPCHNNYMTCLVYLNDLPLDKGGGTTFTNLGLHTGRDGKNFYTEPAPLDSTLQHDGAAWDWNVGHTLTIQPQQGMALLHFCSLLPDYGGICDGNTFHRGDPPEDGFEKFICQQFVASCSKWDLPDDSLPMGRISNDSI